MDVGLLARKVLWNKCLNEESAAQKPDVSFILLIVGKAAAGGGG